VDEVIGADLLADHPGPGWTAAPAGRQWWSGWLLVSPPAGDHTGAMRCLLRRRVPS